MFHLVLLVLVAVGLDPARSSAQEQDPPQARAFRALGELGLKADPVKSVNIVRQLMQGLEEENKNGEPLDAGDPASPSAREFSTKFRRRPSAPS